MHNVEELRKRLLAVLAIYPNSKVKLSKDIGISYTGLHKFMAGTPKSMKVLSIIEGYIQSKEREITLNSNL